MYGVRTYVRTEKKIRLLKYPFAVNARDLKTQVMRKREKRKNLLQNLEKIFHAYNECKIPNIQNLEFHPNRLKIEHTRVEIPFFTTCCGHTPMTFLKNNQNQFTAVK